MLSLCKLYFNPTNIHPLFLQLFEIHQPFLRIKPGFRIRIFFCGSGSGQKSSCGSGSGSWGSPGEGAGGKGKKWFFFFLVFFTFQMILNNGCLKSELKKWNCLHCTSPTLQNNDLFIHFLTFLPGSGPANLCGSGQGKNMRILRIRIRNPA